MDFRVLGQLEVDRRGASVALGSFKQRSLLALLLIHANQVVSTDRIIDELWGDQPHADRQNALWVHVSNLRSALEPDREKRSEGTLLLTRSPGYMLQVGPDELDSARFERLVAEGRGLVDVDPGAASMVLGEGLGLWRGRPYSDVMYESYAQPEIGRLEEVRLEAVELRIDADLRRGLAAELIGELESLARQHPLRERFAEQLMVALYRSGRQAEALRAFGRLRSHLGEELGIEPSASLSALEERIVVADPTLDLAPVADASQARLTVRGYELRERLGNEGPGITYRAYQPAAGREVAVEVIESDLANDPEFIRSFEAHAELIARLEHPYIVPLYDYWRQPDAAYLVTGLPRGESLEAVVRSGPLDPEAAAQVVEDVGSALAFAHNLGVVHGAVSPETIVVDEEGRAHLANFGVAAKTGTASSDLRDLAIALGYALTGRRPTGDDPVPSELPPALARVVGSAVSGDGYHDADSFVAAVRAALGTAAPPAEETRFNPYKGLRPFEEADSADFFGRERLVERLLARLGESGTRGRFIALVGPSGSGKSSAVSAGLLPALRGGAFPGSGEWFVADITPGTHPYEELEAALLGIAVDPPPSLLDQLLDDETGIHRAVKQVLPDPQSHLLLVVDQFEELFTQAPAATANAFLDTLAAAVADPQSPLRVLVTLRADFYDRPLRHRGVGELFRSGTEVITPLSPYEVERAVTGPAERVGATFEAGLVAQVVADVAERPGALPLLQYALTELYDRRRGSIIELSAYRDIGGLGAALARRAEALFYGFDDAEKRAARQVLLRLVTLGEGTEDVRRRVLRQELLSLGEPDVEAVLDSLGRHRLLSFDRDPVTRGPTVEIAHEALLAEWDRLRGWIDANREDVRQQRRLAAAADEWQAAGQDPDYLLSGTRLDQLAAWAALTDLSLDPGERAILTASIDRRNQEQASEEDRRRDEERLRLRTRGRTRLLIASGTVLVVVAGLAALAFIQRNAAESLANQLAASDQAGRLASASGVMVESDPDTAMLLALQSLDSSARAGIPARLEAEESLHWALQTANVPYPITELPIEVRSGPLGPTGIFRLPLDDLVALAQSRLGGRAFTDAECAAHGIAPCPRGDAGTAWPAIPAEPERPDLPDQARAPLAGTQISIIAEYPEELWAAELERFMDVTGIDVRYGPLDGGSDRSGVPPDLAINDHWVTMANAEAGRLVDMSTYVDPAAARAQFGDHIIDASSIGEDLFAVPLMGGLEGIVWYPLDAFSEAGYNAPESWDQLIDLSERMVADGRTPWCLEQSTDDGAGDPATDWVEALVLRVGGVDLYDSWMAGEVGFDHPTVREAVAMFGEVVFGEGFLMGGEQSSSIGGLVDSMSADPPGCWMNLNASWMAEEVRRTTGADMGFFVLPPLEPDGDAPVVALPTMLEAYRDRPEVREFVTFLFDRNWGVRWADVAATTYLSPSLGFGVHHCRSDELYDLLKVAANEVRVSLCELQRDTLDAGLQRLDASDHMPEVIGGDWLGGAFVQGMIDYVAQGPDSLDAVLADIEEARREVIAQTDEP